MIDLRLDPDTWDLVVDSDLYLVVDQPQVVQHIRQRLQTFLGEWFLDLTVGVPWFQRILGKVQYISTVTTILKATVAETTGVKEVTSFTVAAADAERTLRCTFSCVLTSGETLSDVIEVSA